MKNITLLAKITNTDGGIISPQYPTDCGYDLVTSVDATIPPNQSYPLDISCGVHVKLPQGVWGMIVGRSSTIRKYGIEIVLGVIDETFTGVLYACCYNRTTKPITIPQGTRLAQLILMPMVLASMQIVEDLPKTDRGQQGFGSTGK